MTSPWHMTPANLLQNTEVWLREKSGKKPGLESVATFSNGEWTLECKLAQRL